MQFIIKLFPEITIKSAPVRRQMVRHLAQNLSRLLKPLDASLKIERDWDKLVIHSALSEPAACERMHQLLVSTPGIAQVLEVEEFALVDLETLTRQVLAVVGDAVQGRRFAVRCKRAGRKHEFTSLDIERAVGAALLASGKTGRVDLGNPEVTVRLEVRDERVFIVKAKHAGLGGFPLGAVEPVLSLISGGFDSAVSSFLAMKRGMRTHFLFFNLGGHAHEIAVKEVALYLWLRYGASHRVLFITVPFEDVVAEILGRVSDSQMGVVLKRCMLRVAERVADELEIPALVTGESVAQVSSQTLTNLSVIDRVTDMLVLRPLVAMDKGDIIDLATRIGTEPFSRHMPEYCGVISKSPTTRAKLARIEQEEAAMNAAVLEAAIAAKRAVPINALADDLQAPVQIPETAVLQSNDVVLDIRHPAERDVPPPGVGSNPCLVIPFYELHRRVAELDREQCYWLYCDRGVMSRLHAGYLQEQGYARAGVYRPS